MLGRATLGRVKLGLISDVHGNRIALDAVVADATRQGVDSWWVLGDVVAIGPEPVETAEVVANLPNVRVTRGNSRALPPHRASAAAVP